MFFNMFCNCVYLVYIYRNICWCAACTRAWSLLVLTVYLSYATPLYSCQLGVHYVVMPVTVLVLCYPVYGAKCIHVVRHLFVWLPEHDADWSCPTGMLVFVLPPESGEKVSLALTAVLAMTMFQLVIAESIPPTSEVVPLIGKPRPRTWLCVSLGL